MMPAILTVAILSAAPTAEQLKLLTVFRQEFIKITPGKGKYPISFTRGIHQGLEKNDAPLQKVTFRRSFSIAKYEVPQNLWEAVMGRNPSRWKGPRNSVEELTFADAQAFSKKTTELMRQAGLIKPSQEIRLPTEAEWEYTARAGTTTLFSFGDKVESLDEYGWHTGNAAGNDPPVGAKKPNPWGLYDVHGYLWEWCVDAWHENYQGAPKDGSARTKNGDSRRAVLRGGSWREPAERCTGSYRWGVLKTMKRDDIGLRCVLDIVEKKAP